MISSFLVIQATPGFELGKKDLQSPALPLGHAAKMIQNRIDAIFPGLLNFYCTCILTSVFLNPLFPKIKERPLLIGFDPSLMIDCIVSENTQC